MKATDFRPEHFSKGQSFSKQDFDAYIQESKRFAKTSFTVYLPCVAGGLLLSLLFSQVVGGLAGNILALVCIFAGLIVGGIFNIKAGRKVTECAQKLGITKEDVKQARQHVKNGTVAWSGGGAYYSPDQPRTSEAQPAADAAAPVAPLPEKPSRALWMAGLIAGAWLLLTVLQLIFDMRLVFSGSALVLFTAALLGTAVYLMTQPDLKWKLFSGGIGVVTALLMASSYSVNARNNMFYTQPTSLELFFPFDALFFNSLKEGLICALICLGAALLISYLLKVQSVRRVRLCGLCAAAIYLIVRIVSQWLRFYSILINSNVQKIELIFLLLPILAAAAAVCFVCMAAYALCTMKTTKVKLHGIGLVWACLAALGAITAIISVIIAGSNGISGPAIPGITRPYTHQIIIGLCGLSGYILLLCKKRVGLFIIILGTALPLTAQLVSALSAIRASYGLELLLTSLAGGLNPLFAWLAVRAGTSVAPAAPAAAVSYQNPSPAPSVPRPAPPVAVREQKPVTILDKYRAGLSYLDSCGAFDEAKFRQFNLITGSQFSEADIQSQLGNARMMINGMDDLKKLLRSTMVEGIDAFEKIEQGGIDLSKYNL